MLLGQDFLKPKIDPRVYKEAKSLVDNGYDITVCCASAIDNKLISSEIIDKIKVIRFKDQANITSFRQKSFFFAIPYLVINTLKNISKFKKNAKEINPDVIHCHDADTIFAGALIKVLSLGKIKLVYDSHEIATEMESFRKFRPIIWITESFASFFVDGFITINEPVKDFILKRFFNFKKNSLVLRNVPVTTKIFKPSMVNNPVRFVYQGTLKKGRRELLEDIVSTLSQSKFKNWNLDIYGKKEEIAADSIIKNNPRIKFKKMIINPGKFFQALSQYDLGIIATHNNCLNNYLTLPNKLFDYMATGVAIFSPDHPIIKDIVKTCEIGYVFDYRKRDISIAKTIEQILEKPKSLLPFKKNGPIWIQKKYNWSIEEKKLLSFYSKLTIS